MAGSSLHLTAALLAVLALAVATETDGAAPTAAAEVDAATGVPNGRSSLFNGIMGSLWKEGRSTERRSKGVRSSGDRSPGGHSSGGRSMGGRSSGGRSTEDYKCKAHFRKPDITETRTYLQPCGIPTVTCPCDNPPYRQFSGACNNPDNTGLGSAGGPFNRVLKARYVDGVSQVPAGRRLPKARVISKRLFKDKDRKDPVHTLLLMQWSQLIGHDGSSRQDVVYANGSSIDCCAGNPFGLPQSSPRSSSASSEEDHDNVEVTSADGLCTAVKVNSAGAHSKPTCVPFVRSESTTCTVSILSTQRNMLRSPAPPDANAIQPLDFVSSFLDLSPVYGSSDAKNQALREGTGGLLKSRQVLAKDVCFANEDNRSASSKSHSSSDERDSSASRGRRHHHHSQPADRELLPFSPVQVQGCNPKITVCYRAGDDRVHSQPWLASLQTILLREHNRLARKLGKLHPQWNDETLFQEARRILIAEWQLITYREFLPKLVGKKILKKLHLRIDPQQQRTNYNSSINPSTLIEFAHAASTAQHSLIDGRIIVLDKNRRPVLKLRLNQHAEDPTMLEFGGNLEGTVRGLTYEAAQLLDRFVTEEMTSFGFDLVSVDILRGRDHGAPSYNDMRKICGGRKARRFEDLKDVMTEKSIHLLKKLYRSVHDVDLYVGGILEEKCDKAVVGPTFACIIAEQFYRWQYGDRYFFDLQTGPAPFTSDQYRALTKVTLAGLLCDNMDGEKYMQPDPFQRVCEKNKLKRCKDIPSLDLHPWENYTLPQQCISTEEPPPVDR